MTEEQKVVSDTTDASLFEISGDAVTEIEIYNPRTKLGTGMYFTVYSKDSEVAKKILRKQQDRRLLQMKRSRGGLSLTAEELENEKMELLTGCVKSMRGVRWHGAEVQNNPQDLRDLFKKAPPIQEQIEDAIEERALFTKA